MIFGKLKLTTKDKQGNIKSYREEPMRSFNLNFLALLANTYMDTAFAYVSDTTDGTKRNLGFGSADAPIDNKVYGVVCGLGDTAEHVDDYKLEDNLLDQVDPGDELDPSAVTLGVRTGTTSGLIELNRDFINDTGSTVSVAEVGIYIKATDGSSEDAYTVMIIRDVLAVPVDVIDGDVFLVEYDLTFGSSFIDNLDRSIGTVMQTTPGTSNYCVEIAGGGINPNQYKESSSDAADFYPLPQGAYGDVDGLVIGTGDTAFAYDQYALVTPVASGLSDWEHYAQTITMTDDNSTITNLVITRRFANRTGGSLDIKEIGYYSNLQVGGTPETMMLFRYVPTPVTVADNYHVLITFTIRTTM